MLSVLMYVWYYTAATHFILALANRCAYCSLSLWISAFCVSTSSLRLASMALIIFMSFGSFRILLASAWCAYYEFL